LNEFVHCLLAIRSLIYNGVRYSRESRCRNRFNTTFTITHNLHHAFEVLRRRIIIYTCSLVVAYNTSSCSRKHTSSNANLHYVSKTFEESSYTLASSTLLLYSISSCFDSMLWTHVSLNQSISRLEDTSQETIIHSCTFATGFLQNISVLWISSCHRMPIHPPYP